MMPRRAMVSAPSILPLFVCDELSAIDRLTREREHLIHRISRLKPHSHVRIVLQARLAHITGQLLALEGDIKRRVM